MPRQSQSLLSKARRERERSEMTARIKDIAREMFVRDGYEAVTLQKIAAALEYTTPAIYRYFKDKADLLTTIVLEDMQDLHSTLLDCAHIEDPLEQLMEMARRNTAWAVSHPNHYLLFYSRAWIDQEDAVRRDAGVPVQQEPLAVLYCAVEQLIAQCLFRSEFSDPSLVARTLWAGIHGVIMLEITMSGYDKSLIHDKGHSALDRLETMISGLMRGFLKQ